LTFSLKSIAEKVGGRIVGDSSVMIEGINSLEAARPGEISFFTDPRFKRHLDRTKASALIVSKEIDAYRSPQLVVENPGVAYARVAHLFAPAVPRYPGISERAEISESSHLGKGASIYPGVYIGEKAIIGDEVVLFPGVFVGDGVEIGKRSVIRPNVTIMEGCSLGADVIVHAGTVIGSDGFGYVMDGSVRLKIPQIGTVQIDDEVELGANNCIDRAALGKTWIQRGVKTDNFVHVAHNVIIGEDTIILAQTAFSGSVRVGRQAVIGGQVAIADHLDIGDRVMIAGQSGVVKSVGNGEVVSGSPGLPHRRWLKSSTLFKRLPELQERLYQLERKVKGLSGDHK